MTTINDQYRDILGSVAYGTLVDTFGRMDVAEETIAEAGLTKAQSQGAFARCCPTQPLRGKSLDVFKSHCAEIARRVKAGEDLALATEAEVLCALVDAALVAPLRREGAALADWLWPRVMAYPLPGPTTPEAYSGQVAEDLAQARRKLASR